MTIHGFAIGAKIASRFETFSEDEIWAINEAVMQTNTKKATNFGLSVFTGRYKIIFVLNLPQNCKNTLDKIPEMFVNCKQSSYKMTFLIYQTLFFFHFYPTDLLIILNPLRDRYIPQCFASPPSGDSCILFHEVTLLLALALSCVNQSNVLHQ